VKEPFNVFGFRKDTGEFKVGITFLCDIVSGEVKISPEHSDYRFIDPSEFQNFESVPSLHQEIDAYATKYE